MFNTCINIAHGTMREKVLCTPTTVDYIIIYHTLIWYIIVYYI